MDYTIAIFTLATMFTTLWFLDGYLTDFTKGQYEIKTENNEGETK